MGQLVTIKSRKGQSTIEAALVLMVATVIFAGIIKSWVWMNDSSVKELRSYHSTRTAAGSSHPGVNWDSSHEKLKMF